MSTAVAEVAKVATDVVIASQSSGAPGTPNDVLFWVSIIAAIVAAAVAIAFPLMKVARAYNQTSNANASDNNRTAAEEFLYSHIKSELTDAKTELGQTRKENLELQATLKELEFRLKGLESERDENRKYRDRLEKAQRDNLVLENNLKLMENRIKALEVLEDENKDLREQLAKKDAHLGERELKIHELFDTLIYKDNKIEELERRLSELSARLGSFSESFHLEELKGVDRGKSKTSHEIEDYQVRDLTSGVECSRA